MLKCPTADKRTNRPQGIAANLLPGFVKTLVEVGNLFHAGKILKRKRYRQTAV